MPAGKANPTFTIIAKAAGVSVSTVDRVLNERDSVSDKKRRAVLEAARAMGIRRILPSASHGHLHFDVIMTKSDTPHYQRLRSTIQEFGRKIASRATVHCVSWSEKHQGRMLNYLINPPHPRHGLVVVTHDTPSIRGLLNQIIDQGVPTIVMSSDVGGLKRHTYVGVDNYAAGRTAGYLLQLAATPHTPMLAITHSLKFTAHRQRMDGFIDAVRDADPERIIIGPLEGLDESTRNQQLLLHTLQQYPELGAVYSSGAGANGIGTVLAQRPQSDRPAWITHEVTPQHIGWLDQHILTAVIDQAPEAQATAALQHLLHLHGELTEVPALQPPFQLITPENMKLVSHPAVME